VDGPLARAFQDRRDIRHPLSWRRQQHRRSR
jgi:hypothetical protein